MTQSGVSGETDLPYSFGFGGGSVDGCVFVDGRKTGLAEIKGGEHSLAGAKREVSVYGSTVSMDQRASGIAAKDIIVPEVVYNGQSMQFCATFMLETALPVFMTVSKQFDLDDPDDNREAGRFWMKFLEASKDIPVAAESPDRDLRLELCCAEYWIKTLSEEVLSHGLGLFAPTGAYEHRVAAGLEHMIRPLNALYRHPPARQVTVFPLCVISPGSNESTGGVRSSVSLVYPDISKDGFQVGVPDHCSNTFLQYVTAVEEAVKAVHEAGVVHMDLYVSNIMHRVRADGAVEIKFVDWDVAHLIGERICDQVLQARRGGHDRPEAEAGPKADLNLVAALRKDGTKEIWQQLAVGSTKQAMDIAFFNLYNLAA